MNSFGIVFRVSVFGESHGCVTGVTIDGCPAGIAVKPEDFTEDLARRKSGSAGTTKRHESDLPQILSGVFNGHTTGSPITVITPNKDTDSSVYTHFSDIPRPGHADYTARIKYSGYADMRGSGHFSGRITWGLVVAGVLAKKLNPQILISAQLISAGGSENIQEALQKAMALNDTIGGIIECRVKNMPAGLGEPFFYSVESAISQIIFSISAIKGIEFGAGFSASSMKGSVHNDPITDEKGTTATNNAGGINGGISNGNDIIFRVAVKPTSSTGVEQTTYNFRSRRMEVLRIEGRHDTCIALRMPVIVEAATAIVIADLMMIDRGVFNRK